MSSSPATTAGSGGGKSKKSKSPKSTAQKLSTASVSNTSSVLEFLKTRVDKETLLQLYVDEQRGAFVCRAVSQQLSLPAQQVLMRLQCTGGSFPLASVSVWFVQGVALLNQVVLPELRQWSMIQKLGNPGDGPMEVVMTAEFKQGFTASLCRLHASPWQSIPTATLQEWDTLSSNTASTEGRKRKSSNNKPSGLVTPEDLERYTQTVWDSVLHFLVGTDHSVDPPAAVVHFLLQTGLMQTDPEYSGRNLDEAPLVITEKGYDFMLQDNHEQVWHFCLQYLQVVSQNKEKGERMVREALLLLICLSFARIGEAYPASSLSKSGRRMLRDLAHFGLLYVQEFSLPGSEAGTTTSKVVFYPTRVALSLIGHDAMDADNDDAKNSLIPASAQWSLSSKALDEALAHPTPHDSAHLAIIVQTNFQVCAYTTSELHVSMLALFCDVSTIRRLPNVVFMMMTRDSVKAAFHLGIQARQILRFLEKHAHPKLRAPNPATGLMTSPIPSNVVDQIWLWDRERGRVEMTLVFQHQCLMEGEFEVLYAFTTQKCLAHVWSSQSKQLLYLDYEHVERITAFVRKWRAGQAARQRGN